MIRRRRMWIWMSLYKSNFISPCLRSRYVMLIKIDENKEVDVVYDGNKNAGQGQLITGHSES